MLLAVVPFKQSHDGGFGAAAGSLDDESAALLVHVLCEAADESFVGFNYSAKLLVERPDVQGVTNAVKHKPRGFLCDPQSAMQFPTADAVFAIDLYPKRSHPFFERKGRILHD